MPPVGTPTSFRSRFHGRSLLVSLLLPLEALPRPPRTAPLRTPSAAMGAACRDLDVSGPAGGAYHEQMSRRKGRGTLLRLDSAMLTPRPRHV